MQKAWAKVSSKYQVVIPKAVREELRIQPGQRLFMYTYEGGIKLSLCRSIREIRGVAKGMKWRKDYHHHEDRF